jgi:hypothetical protein
MTTSTIVLIVVVAVVAILLIATIASVVRNKRTQHRRVEAGDIRDKAAEQSHKVGHRAVVARLGRADEVVVRDVEQSPCIAEALAGAVGLFLRRDAVRLGGALALESVFVGAGQEEDVLTQQPVPPGECVGDDRGVGVPDVRGALT